MDSDSELSRWAHLDFMICRMARSMRAVVGRTPLATTSSTAETRPPRSSPFRPIIRALDRAIGMGESAAAAAAAAAVAVFVTAAVLMFMFMFALLTLSVSPVLKFLLLAFKIVLFVFTSVLPAAAVPVPVPAAASASAVAAAAAALRLHDARCASTCSGLSVAKNSQRQIGQVGCSRSAAASFFLRSAACFKLGACPTGETQKKVAAWGECQAYSGVGGVIRRDWRGGGRGGMYFGVGGEIDRVQARAPTGAGCRVLGVCLGRSWGWG